VEQRKKILLNWKQKEKNKPLKCEGE